MTAIGALIGSSVLPATATFIWAIAGAFIGDCFGFWLGNHYHLYDGPFGEYINLPNGLISVKIFLPSMAEKVLFSVAL